MRLRRTEDPGTEHLPEGYDDEDGDWYVAPVERPLYRRDPVGESALAANPANRWRWLLSRGYTEEQIHATRTTKSGSRTTMADPRFVIALDNDELDRFGHWHARELARRTLGQAEEKQRWTEEAEARRKVAQLCGVCGESDDTVYLLRRLTHESGVSIQGFATRWTPHYDELRAHQACALSHWSAHEHQP